MIETQYICFYLPISLHSASDINIDLGFENDTFLPVTNKTNIKFRFIRLLLGKIMPNYVIHCDFKQAGI